MGGDVWPGYHRGRGRDFALHYLSPLTPNVCAVPVQTSPDKTQAPLELSSVHTAGRFDKDPPIIVLRISAGDGTGMGWMAPVGKKKDLTRQWQSSLTGCDSTLQCCSVFSPPHKPRVRPNPRPRITSSILEVGHLTGYHSPQYLHLIYRHIPFSQCHSVFNENFLICRISPSRRVQYCLVTSAKRIIIHDVV